MTAPIPFTNPILISFKLHTWEFAQFNMVHIWTVNLTIKLIPQHICENKNKIYWNLHNLILIQVQSLELNTLLKKKPCHFYATNYSISMQVSHVLSNKNPHIQNIHNLSYRVWRVNHFWLSNYMYNTYNARCCEEIYLLVYIILYFKSAEE